MTDDKILNFSVASSTVDIVPDKQRIKKYDLYYKGYIRFSLLHLFISVGTTYGLINLYLTNHYIWASLLVPVALIFLFFSYSMYNGSKPQVYNQGLLVPAVITSTHPLEIVALANLESSNPDGVTWGCKRIDIKALPDHSIMIGERVPCIALFSSPSDGIYTFFEPRPLTWATSDKANILNALQQIEPEEWELLNSVAKRVNELKINSLAKIDKDQNFVVL